MPRNKKNIVKISVVKNLTSVLRYVHKCIEEKTHIITSFQRFNNGAKIFVNTYLHIYTILANMVINDGQFFCTLDMGMEGWGLLFADI